MDPPPAPEAAWVVPAPDAAIPAAFRFVPGDVDRWGYAPLADELHPVGVNLWRRYHLLVEEKAAGPTPNATLNPLLCEADVHWRLLAATGTGLPLTTDDAGTWVDGAEAATLLGVDALLDEILDRAPGLDALRTVADFATQPSVDIGAGPKGKLHVTHENGGPVVRRSRQADEELRPDVAAPRPRFAFGVGWQLKDPDAPADDPLIEWGAWTEVQNLGITNARAEVSFVDDSWSVTARRRLLPHVFATASVRSVDGGADPGTFSVGASVQLPDDPRWTMRLDRVEAVDLSTTTWRFTVHAELGAWLPGRLSPPLAPLPSVPDSGPIPTSTSATRTSCCT